MEADHTKDHLVCVFNVHHRRATGDVKSVTPRFTTFLSESDEVYRREVTVGEKWVGLETAWVADPSCVVVEVLAGGGVDLGVRCDVTGNVLVAQTLRAGQAVPLISPQKVYARSSLSAQTRIRVTAVPH